jgi:hypothetical protein
MIPKAGRDQADMLSVFVVLVGRCVPLEILFDELVKSSNKLVLYAPLPWHLQKRLDFPPYTSLVNKCFVDPR